LLDAPRKRRIADDGGAFARLCFMSSIAGYEIRRERHLTYVNPFEGLPGSGSPVASALCRL
jgi:hypothetical protein